MEATRQPVSFLDERIDEGLAHSPGCAFVLWACKTEQKLHGKLFVVHYVTNAAEATCRCQVTLQECHGSISRECPSDPIAHPGVLAFDLLECVFVLNTLSECTRCSCDVRTIGRVWLQRWKQIHNMAIELILLSHCIGQF